MSDDGTLISNKVIEFGLSWDFFDGMDPVDLDAQAVCFDGTGKVVDCAFYNQLSACDGSVVHSGDNRTGEGEGDEEAITIDFDRLPKHVKAIAMVVTAYSGGTFQSVETAHAELREVATRGGRPVVATLALGCQGQHTAAIFAVLHQDGAGRWRASQVREATQGRHFQECLPALRQTVDRFLDPDLVGERVLSLERTFVMEKDDVAAVPAAFDEVRLGCGWETPNTDLDLDASCLMLAEDFRADPAWAVSFKQLQLPGVKHSGDNLTGAGEGDDEEIAVRFSEVPARIHHLAFVVNCYSDGRSFDEVFDSYIRMVAPTPSGEHELARYTLDGNIRSRGLLFAVFSRCPGAAGGGGGGGGGGWTLRAVGAPVRGKRAVDPECMADVVRAARKGRGSEDGGGKPPPLPSHTAAAAAARGGRGDEVGPAAPPPEGGCGCVVS